MYFRTKEATVLLHLTSRSREDQGLWWTALTTTPPGRGKERQLAMLFSDEVCRQPTVDHEAQVVCFFSSPYWSSFLVYSPLKMKHQRDWFCLTGPFLYQWLHQSKGAGLFRVPGKPAAVLAHLACCLKVAIDFRSSWKSMLAENLHLPDRAWIFKTLKARLGPDLISKGEGGLLELQEEGWRHSAGCVSRGDKLKSPVVLKETLQSEMLRLPAGEP